MTLFQRGERITTALLLAGLVTSFIARHCGDTASCWLTLSMICFVNAIGFALTTYRQQIGKWVVRVWPGVGAVLKMVGIALLWILGGIVALFMLVFFLEYGSPTLLCGWNRGNGKPKRCP